MRQLNDNERILPKPESLSPSKIAKPGDHKPMVFALSYVQFGLEKQWSARPL
jgi:hypothetical protein